MTIVPEPDVGSDAERRGLWGRLDGQLGLVAMRPRLGEGVRLRNIGTDWELVQISTRRVVPLHPDDVATVRLFDGEHTVAEMIVAGIGAGTMQLEPVLRLVDRLVRAEMLAEYPPDLYKQIVSHFDRLTARDAARVRSPDRSIPSAVGAQTSTADAAEVVLTERARLLRGVALLAALDVRTLVALAEAAEEITIAAADDIVVEGSCADRFYIVRSGDVNVTRRDATGSEQRIARLSAGSWFGEVGLLEGAPRNATVRAGTSRPVRLLTFDADTFARFIEPFVTTRAGRELVSRRRAQLERIPLFQALAAEDLDRLARILREATAPAGTVLFRQGDAADSFYVIVEGAVGVVKDGKPIAKLLAGEFFGETALLFTEARTATVATTQDSRFWVLERDSFTTFVRDALLHRRDLMPTVLNRLGSTTPV